MTSILTKAKKMMPSQETVRRAFDRLDEENMSLIQELVTLGEKKRVDPFGYWKNIQIEVLNDDPAANKKDKGGIVFFPFSPEKSLKDTLSFMEHYILLTLNTDKTPIPAKILDTKLFLHRFLLDMKDNLASLRPDVKKNSQKAVKPMERSHRHVASVSIHREPGIYF